MKKSKKYEHQVAKPYEIVKKENNFYLVYQGKHVLKKLLAQSEDGRDRESVLKIKEFENEL